MKFLIAVVLVLTTGVSVESKGRIFGGSNANTDNFKYHAKIVALVSETMGYSCGGSVISNSWLLTAAHCFTQGIIIRTYASLGLDKNYEFTKVVNATKIIIHENYFANKSTVVNDIAVVSIPYVVYNQYIQKLPLSGSNNIDGQNVTVSGWGLTGSNTASKLQSTTLIVRDENICRDQFGYLLPSTQFCTWDLSTTTCGGDSGGSVTAVFDLIEKQVGLVSFGGGTNCTGGKPTSYTRVYSYLPWISKHTGVQY